MNENTEIHNLFHSFQVITYTYMGIIIFLN